MTEDADTASGRIGALGVNFEYSVQKATASALMSAARVEKGMAEPESISQTIHAEASQATGDDVSERLAGATVLWVDDDPSNNRFERISLEALDIEVTTALSTEEALEQLRANEYDVVISDMGRPESDVAGYDLLDEMQRVGSTASVIIYAGEWRQEFVEETRRRGGFGNTNDPQELLRLVQSAILYPAQSS